MMSSDYQQPRLDQFTLTVHGGDTSLNQISIVSKLYAEVFAEPPYREGRAEVEDFASSWSKLVDQPNFRLVIADRMGEPVGFSFGHQLRVSTNWWDGALTAPARRYYN